MSRSLTSLFLGGAICLCVPLMAPAALITIDTVHVGNLGNANDSTGFGAVGYDYRIGTTEVTNAQYAAFLNEKAKSNPLGLYNPNMGSSARGGITRSGVSGSYTYAPKTNMGDKPVNYVSWYDSIRFANWLHNGQGLGDTETGAYTLLGGTATPINGLSITRNVGATWFLTSEDEWYKAAYYQPTADGGDADNYWLYPTKSNTDPTLATADSVGNISNPGTNVVNYFRGADWNGQDGNVTTVGSAVPLSESFYGTSDQGGNVWEWNEALISGSFRGLRGASWFNDVFSLQSSLRVNNIDPAVESERYGFRVATVPEPSTLVLAACGGLTALACGYRRRRRGDLKRGMGNEQPPRPCAKRVLLLIVMGVSGFSSPAWAGMVSDDFNTPHDYLAQGTAGTLWDGVRNTDHLATGDASVSQPGLLTWGVLPNAGWEFNLANGPVLFRNVAGDFDVSVSVAGMSTVYFSDGGLIVRAPQLADAGPGEDYVALRYFFGINAVRSTDNSNTQNFNHTPMHPHLRITRTGTSFEFYTRALVSDAWSLRQQLTRADLGALSDLEVGLWFGTFSTPPGFAQFDNFELSGPLVPEPSSGLLAAFGGLTALAYCYRRRRIVRR